MPLNSKSGDADRKPDLKNGANSGVLTLLVAEDEDVLRVLTARILRREGYVVLEAQSAEAALEDQQAQMGRVDVLVSDVNLSGADGFQLFSWLRRFNPRLKAVFMSGSCRDSAMKSDQLPPGTLFLEKPFDARGLVSAIREAVRPT